MKKIHSLKYKKKDKKISSRFKAGKIISISSFGLLAVFVLAFVFSSYTPLSDFESQKKEVLASSHLTTAIDFIEEDFSVFASMFAEAGGIGSELIVPTGDLSPEPENDSYSFGPSHSHNDGIGNSTSKVEQEYQLDRGPDGNITSFSFDTNPGGEFRALNAGPFEGEIRSVITTDVSFTVPQLSSLSILNLVTSSSSDNLPGDGYIAPFALIKLIKESNGQIINCVGVGEGPSCSDFNVSPENLIPGEIYRLEIEVESKAVFDGVFENVNDVYEFETITNYGISVAPIPDDDPGPNPNGEVCELAGWAWGRIEFEE